MDRQYKAEKEEEEKALRCIETEEEKALLAAQLKEYKEKVDTMTTELEESKARLNNLTLKKNSTLYIKYI